MAALAFCSSAVTSTSVAAVCSCSAFASRASLISCSISANSSFIFLVDAWWSAMSVWRSFTYGHQNGACRDIGVRSPNHMQGTDLVRPARYGVGHVDGGHLHRDDGQPTTHQRHISHSNDTGLTLRSNWSRIVTRRVFSRSSVSTQFAFCFASSRSLVRSSTWFPSCSLASMVRSRSVVSISSMASYSSILCSFSRVMSAIFFSSFLLFASLSSRSPCGRGAKPRTCNAQRKDAIRKETHHSVPGRSLQNTIAFNKQLPLELRILDNTQKPTTASLGPTLLSV
mmetsp:Transcript_5783/g.14851  ORF Transcript_5783/g.14851 Transcript_5783/m.14851 type:complete len:283 (+) Transcript_5783:1848-2696(+)